MNFDDPVAAFANFKRILKQGGALAFTCWRSLQENELDYVPLATAGFLHSVDERPFSFAEPDHVRGVLEAAGFRQIRIEAHDEKVSSGNIEAMIAVLLSVGPLGKIVRESRQLRAPAEARLRAAFAARGELSTVELLASIWVVTARA